MQVEQTVPSSPEPEPGMGAGHVAKDRAGMRHVRIFFSVIAIVVMILCLVRAFHGEPLFPIPIQPSSQAPAASSDGQGVQIGQIQQRLEDLSKSQDDLQRESLALKIPERMATVEAAVISINSRLDQIWYIGIGLIGGFLSLLFHKLMDSWRPNFARAKESA